MIRPGNQPEVYSPKLRISFLSVLLLLSILLDFLQSRFLPLYLNLDWTLIFVFYAGWSANAVRGAVTGTVFGITQDFLLGVMLGVNGAIKTVIGYLASYLSSILNPDLEGLMRFCLLGVVSFLNNLILYKSHLLLAGYQIETPVLSILAGAVLTGIAGDLVFRLLDRMRSSPKQFMS